MCVSGATGQLISQMLRMGRAPSVGREELTFPRLFDLAIAIGDAS